MKRISINSSNQTFVLHPQLAADTEPVAELDLCTLRLMNCREIPWLVLVPMRDGVREITDLSDTDQATLMREISRVSRLLTAHFKPHKLNVAALGNIVPQLHIHAIARSTSDPAWPKPVWGNVPMTPYTPEALASLTSELRRLLATEPRIG